jgi:tetratricopeptide (TPR) repeat protein/energy-coupling factor transporter ATP-binding protein EcfA2
MSFVDARKLIAGNNPFIGLRPFGVADADVFFGREEQVATLLERLRDTRFLAVVGASGCGKSSLVLAGVIPALERGALGGAGSSWRVATMRPGTAPVEALANALARTQVLGEQADDPNVPRARILAALQRGDRGLVDVAGARLRDDENILIVVDQFEELFRYASTADPAAQARDAAAFVNLLLTAAAWPDLCVYVAITVRADFIGECAQFPGLPEAINDSVFLVPRLTRDELWRSIEEPVLRQGERVSPQLVSRLLADVGSDADQLPVLEHALMRTWDAWERDHAPGEPLDERHYELIGTMRGAISKHANALYDGLEPRLRPIAERLFRCLTARESDSHGIRRPTAFGAVCAITAARPADVEQLFRVYAAPGVSFLNASGPLSNPKSTLDITHESLTRLWDRLRAWVDDEAVSGKTYRKLVDDATKKRAHWIDPELAVGQAWLAKNRTSINPAWAARYDNELATLPDEEAVESAAARSRFDAALAFLAAGAAAPRRRLRTVVASVGVFFIVAAVLAITAAFEHSKAGAAQRTASLAQSSALAAEDRARIRSDEARRARAEANASAMKDHADRLQAAKDLADAKNKIALANAQFERARALANYNRTITVARDDPAAAVSAYTKEIHDLGAGVGTPSDLAFAYYARGVAFAKQHENDRARTDFEHALRLKPDYTDAATAKRTLASNPNSAVVAQAPHAAGVAAAATPSPRQSTAPRRQASGAARQSNGDSVNSPACTSALDQQQRAARATITAIASYDASVAGLADNAKCDDPVKRVVNEAYLRSTLAAAEHELNVRDWRAELNRADALLTRCETLAGLRGTSVAADCAAQRKFNEGAAAQWTPLSASPPPSPVPKPSPAPSPTPARR